MVTLGDLQRICPTTRSQILARYVNALNDTFLEFEINTPEREAMFLAQVAHESGGFNYVRELASGGAYEGRLNLGNTEPGDGIRYKGRGLIQITGRANYAACAAALGVDYIAEPELLERPIDATRSAGWYWSSRKLNSIADKGDLLLVTKKINGGTTGYADRQAYYQRATEVLA
jgi:putative chitinase